MKLTPTALLIVLCTSVSLVDMTRAADQCVMADDFGYLDLPDMDQYEPSGPNDQSLWCWVASSNVVTNHFGLIDPSTGSNYTKCRLYNIAKNPGVDCCTTIHSNCSRSGMPYEVFEALNPPIDFYGEANAMNWPQIKDQICPGGNPGHPFIFTAKPHAAAVGHTHVVKGFSLDDQGNRQLLVDDHFGNGAQLIDYECKYKLPADCQDPMYQWDHVGDLKDLLPLLTVTPPSLPPLAPDAPVPSIPRPDPPPFGSTLPPLRP